ncbi:hypothetical protein F5Y16DRAFT_423341 [Xylariaceae sp. FL0255]|nr:hypothetical protein F5Y16DRAFT_423341 [Xylariaceae sp. FL0255]
MSLTDAAIQRARDVGQGVITFFSRYPTLVYQREAGIGRHGGALVFAENHPNGELRRRIVVKYSLGAGATDLRTNADDDLRNEYTWLTILRGAEHIVQLITLDTATTGLPGIPVDTNTNVGNDKDDNTGGGNDNNNKQDDNQQDDGNGDNNNDDGDVSDGSIGGVALGLGLLGLGGRGRGRGGVGGSGSSGSNSGKLSFSLAFSGKGGGNGGGGVPPSSILPTLSTPTFVMEFLEGGTLNTFRERLRKDNQLIPNRLAWRIWLCMVRQCIAMAFPPYPDDPSAIVRERLPAGGVPYDTITQCSTHLNNYVFGSHNPVDANFEHDPNMPTLKLIDFGRGMREDPEQWEGLEPDSTHCGSRVNVCNTAVAFSDLINIGASSAELEVEVDGNAQPYYYKRAMGVSDGECYTIAPRVMRENEMIERSLRDLICRCMNPNADDVPTLWTVHAATETAVMNGLPSDNLDLQAKMGVQETDEYIANFIQRYILNPPP